MVAQAIGDGLSAAWEARYTWCDPDTSEDVISLARNVAAVAVVVFTFFTVAGIPPGMAPSVAHTAKLTMAWMKSATFNWNPAAIAAGLYAITDFVCHLLQTKSTNEEDTARMARLEEREVELLGAVHQFDAENRSLASENRQLGAIIEEKGYRIDKEQIAATVADRLSVELNSIVQMVNRLAGLTRYDSTVSRRAERTSSTHVSDDWFARSRRTQDMLRGLLRNHQEPAEQRRPTSEDCSPREGGSADCCSAQPTTTPRQRDSEIPDTASEHSASVGDFEVVSDTGASNA